MAAVTGEAIAQRLKSLGQRSSPHIDIAIDGAQGDWVATYSTLDSIEGTVTITYPVNTTVKKLSIDFTGTAKTFVERLTSSTAISGRTEAYHQFLKLSQPIPRSTLPANRLFEANKPYKFPFLFVVPRQLLPRVCRHTVASNTVHLEHLQLPPSFGDKNVSERGKTLLDDFAPDMARVNYALQASVQEESFDSAAISPVVRSKPVRILPASDEKAPLSADGPDSEYVMRAEKDIRKGVFKGKLGRLIIEAAQPKAIRVPIVGSEEQTPESTVVTVNLRFEPAEDKAAPPKLGNLSTKFKVSTFFSSSARSRLPSRRDIQWDLTQGMHSETINLASRCVAAADWKAHSGRADSPSQEAADDIYRRGSTTSTVSAASGLSLAGVPEPSSIYTPGKPFYTASVLVPISLPGNKSWLPTFHTCLVSRIYGLSLHLGLSNSPSSGVDLKLPIQISCTGGNGAAEFRRGSISARQAGLLSAEEMAVEAADADDFFSPRTISPLDGRFVGRSSIGQQGGAGPEMDLPPGYDDFPRGGNRVPVAAV